MFHAKQHHWHVAVAWFHEVYVVEYANKLMEPDVDIDDSPFLNMILWTRFIIQH